MSSSMFNKEARIDVSSLFPNGCLPPEGHKMDLRPLRDLASSREFFIPQTLYVRREMHLLLDKLQNLPFLTKIVSGSPGIGKYVTFFLAAMLRALRAGKDVLYFRYTKLHQEAASAFVMSRIEGGPTETSVIRPFVLNVKFNRHISKGEPAASIFSIR